MYDPFDPKPVQPRSVSQLKQYERCPHSYYLARVREPRAWQRPAAWLPQGTAVHAAAEAWERSGRTMSLDAAQDVFREEWRNEVAGYCQITPNFEWWSKSGPYGGKKDLERRFNIGLEQVEKYVRWYTNHPDQVIWIAPDGTPGIELGFDIDLDGVPIKGFIDAVIVDQDDQMIVRDNKTGKNPGDDFQLGVYGLALAETYGIEQPEYGDYWMGGSGKPTYPYRIDYWTKDRVTEAFHKLEDNIRAGNFDPAPDTNKCKFCDVSDVCEYRVA